jgi:hypothetical protein
MTVDRIDRNRSDEREVLRRTLQSLHLRFNQSSWEAIKDRLIILRRTAKYIESGVDTKTEMITDLVEAVLNEQTRPAKIDPANQQTAEFNEHCINELIDLVFSSTDAFSTTVNVLARRTGVQTSEVVGGEQPPSTGPTRVHHTPPYRTFGDIFKERREANEFDSPTRELPPSPRSTASGWRLNPKPKADDEMMFGKPNTTTPRVSRSTRKPAPGSLDSQSRSISELQIKAYLRRTVEDSQLRHTLEKAIAQLCKAGLQTGSPMPTAKRAMKIARSLCKGKIFYNGKIYTDVPAKLELLARLQTDELPAFAEHIILVPQVLTELAKLLDAYVLTPKQKSRVLRLFWTMLFKGSTVDSFSGRNAVPVLKKYIELLRTKPLTVNGQVHVTLGTKVDALFEAVAQGDKIIDHLREASATTLEESLMSSVELKRDTMQLISGRWVSRKPDVETAKIIRAVVSRYLPEQEKQRKVLPRVVQTYKQNALNMIEIVVEQIYSEHPFTISGQTFTTAKEKYKAVVNSDGNKHFWDVVIANVLAT